MCLRKNTENEPFVFKNKVIRNSVKKKIIGVIFDNKPTSKRHVKNLRKKISQKVLIDFLDYGL